MSHYKPTEHSGILFAKLQIQNWDYLYYLPLSTLVMHKASTYQHTQIPYIVWRQCSCEQKMFTNTNYITKTEQTPG